MAFACWDTCGTLYMSHFPVTVTKIPNTHDLKEECIWVHRSIGSVHAWLARRLKQLGERAWQKKAVYSVATRQQKEEGTRKRKG